MASKSVGVTTAANDAQTVTSKRMERKRGEEYENIKLSREKNRLAFRWLMLFVVAVGSLVSYFSIIRTTPQYNKEMRELEIKKINAEALKISAEKGYGIQSYPSQLSDQNAVSSVPVKKDVCKFTDTNDGNKVYLNAEFIMGEPGCVTWGGKISQELGYGGKFETHQVGNLSKLSFANRS